MEQLEFELLGGATVRVDGELVTGFLSNKVQALLIYLAVERRTHTRQALATLFWGDVPESDAKTSLRSALSNLRKLVKPFITITRQHVVLNWDFGRIRTDVLEFESDDNSLAVDTRIGLYRGDFLAGFELSDAPAFETWAVQQQESLRNTALHLLETALAHHAATPQRQLGYLDRLIALEPWREQAHRQKMLLLARQGQHEAAIAQFERCQQILSDELGIAPSAETAALHQRIQTVRKRPARHNLPPDGTPFVGRESELQDLSTWLNDPACRLVTILGGGGNGKTRLATAWARTNVNQFLEGVLFVSLAELDELPTQTEGGQFLPLRGRLGGGSSTERIVLALLAALKQKPQRDPHAQLLRHLQSLEMLLVFDNFEPFVEAAPLLGQLLQAAPQIKILVTSRELLNLQEEWVFDLGGLTYPEAISAEISTFSAIQLFDQTARRSQRQFVLDTNLPAVVQLCQLVEGTPLAIELAAASVRQQPLPQLVSAVRDNMDALQTRYRNQSARHRSLRAVFESSWVLLNDAERDVLGKLGTFRGSFSAEAAQQIANASPELVQQLVEKSLVQSTGNRFRLHEMVRQYSAEKLTDLTAVTIQHIRFFNDTVSFVNAGLYSRERVRAAMQVIDDEQHNLSQATTWAIENGAYDEAQQVLKALHGYANIRGHFHALVARCERHLAQLGEMANSAEPDHLQAILHYQLGFGQERLGRYDAAWQSLQTAREFVSRTDDTEQHLDILVHLGLLAINTNQYETAKTYLQAVIELGDAPQYAARIAASYSQLSEVHIHLGDYEAARVAVERSIEIRRELGNERGLAIANYSLCKILLATGAFDSAEKIARDSIALCERIGEASGSIMMSFPLMEALLERQAYDEAAAILANVTPKAYKIGQPSLILQLLQFRARVEQAQGQFDNATATLAEANQLAVQGKRIDFQAEIAFAMARLSVVRNSADSQAHFDTALALAHQANAQPLIGEIRLEIGMHNAAQGRQQVAIDHLQQVIASQRVTPIVKQQAKEQLGV